MSMQVPQLEVSAGGVIRTTYPTMSREVVASVSEKYASLASLFAASPDLLTAARAAFQCLGEMPPTKARVQAAVMLSDAINKASAPRVLRQITITFGNDRGYAVSENGRIADRLTWDEMLGQISQMTHPKINAERYKMLTIEQYHEQEDKFGTAPEDRLQFDERGIPK